MRECAMRWYHSSKLESFLDNVNAIQNDTTANTASTRSWCSAWSVQLTPLDLDGSHVHLAHPPCIEIGHALIDIGFECSQTGLLYRLISLKQSQGFTNDIAG